MAIFPKDSGWKKKYLSCHHLGCNRKLILSSKYWWSFWSIWWYDSVQQNDKHCRLQSSSRSSMLKIRAKKLWAKWGGLMAKGLKATQKLQVKRRESWEDVDPLEHGGPIIYINVYQLFWITSKGMYHRYNWHYGVLVNMWHIGTPRETNTGEKSISWRDVSKTMTLKGQQEQWTTCFFLKVFKVRTAETTKYTLGIILLIQLSPEENNRIMAFMSCTFEISWTDRGHWIFDRCLNFLKAFFRFVVRDGGEEVLTGWLQFIDVISFEWNSWQQMKIPFLLKLNETDNCEQERLISSQVMSRLGSARHNFLKQPCSSCRQSSAKDQAESREWSSWLMFQTHGYDFFVGSFRKEV